MKKKFSVGSWITLNNLSIAEIMADAGFDWLCIDLEHTAIDYNHAQHLILTIQSKGLKAFVRVGENNSRIIQRVLDAGADGIIVPMVNSKSDALKAVSSVKYPPIGKRGVGLSRAQGYGFNFEDYRDKISKDIILIAQIEHINAVNNLEEIIETDGIDGTFIGPYDRYHYYTFIVQLKLENYKFPFFMEVFYNPKTKKVSSDFEWDNNFWYFVGRNEKLQR